MKIGDRVRWTKDKSPGDYTKTHAFGFVEALRGDRVIVTYGSGSKQMRQTFRREDLTITEN